MSFWMTREYKDLQPEGRRQEYSENEKPDTLGGLLFKYEI